MGQLILPRYIIREFRRSLTALIDGKYSAKDINVVVDIFVTETSRLLIQKESLGWTVRDFEFSKKNEIGAIAIDFIASLFARDEHGVFIVLKQHFGAFQSSSESVFLEFFQNFVWNNTHQEFIRKFRERDPVGKILHRSMRYILTKHEDWEKKRHPAAGLVITKQGCMVTPIEGLSTLEESKSTDPGRGWITQKMEHLLIQHIDIEQKSVPVAMILEEIRIRIQHNLASSEEVMVSEDPVIDMSTPIWIDQTLRRIKSKHLAAYERNFKLSKSDVKAFESTLRAILHDLANGGLEASYFSYLKQFLPISKTEYSLHYKTQFEYIAKCARKDFSARLKSDANL